MGVIDSIVDIANKHYTNLSNLISPNYFLALKLFFFSVLIALTAYVIWKFYNTLSKRNFIVLNLQQYDWSEHPGFKKFSAVIFYFIEYILLMPALILLWFTLLSVILLVLASERGASELLFLSGAMVLAIRLLAYHNEEISKDLAKLFPFIALSIFILTPTAFEVSSFLNNLKEIPSLFNEILYFLIVIFVVEILLRIIYTIFELAKGKEEVGDEIKNEG
jgi:hypothetical protein